MGGGSGSGRGAMVMQKQLPMPSVGHSSSYDGPDGRIRGNSSEGEETVGTTDSTRSTDSPTDSPGSDGSRRRPGRGPASKAGGGGGGRRARSLSPPHVPKGLKNVGNSCYANATLQCLLSTALTHALLDPSQAIIFRRYASNPNILAAGSGSVDSDLDDEYEFASEIGLDIGDFGCTDPNACTDSPPSPDASEKRKRLEKKLERREKRRKAKEMQGMRETCQWITGELTDITREYTVQSASQQQQPEQTGLLATSFFSFLSSIGDSPTKADDKTIVDPGAITRHVDKLCRTLRPYQQEDAHEFLRALLSSLTMAGQNRQLSSLFDGLLESAVTCQTCRYSSLTRDRYMDLSLDISDSSVSDLEGALAHFTKTEKLDASNMVECTKCREKRIVTKGLRLATAPTILVCHLKRFSCDMYGRLSRISKDVDFPQRLELDRYMSRANRSTPPPYELVGVLVHAGRSCDCGHYYSFVKSGSRWYKCNDAVINEVDVSTVLRQKAYVLIYEVEGMREKHGCETYNKYHSSPTPPPPPSLGKAPSASPKNKKTNESSKKDKATKKKKAHVRSQSAPRPLRDPSPMHGWRKAAPSSRNQAPGKMRGGDDQSDTSFTRSLLNILDACAGTADSFCGGGASTKICNRGGDDEEDDVRDDLTEAAPSTNRRSDYRAGSTRDVHGLEDADPSWDSSDDDADDRVTSRPSPGGFANKGRMPPRAPRTRSRRRLSQAPDNLMQEDSLDATWHPSRTRGNDSQQQIPQATRQRQQDSLDASWHASRTSRGNDSLDATWHAPRHSRGDPLDSTWHPSRSTSVSPPPSTASRGKETIISPNQNAAARKWGGAGTRKASSEVGLSMPDLLHRRAKSLSSAEKKTNDSDTSESEVSPSTTRERPPLPK